MNVSAAARWSPGYRELPPPAGLGGLLACLWICAVPADGSITADVMPDGCADLIWQSGVGAYIAGPDTGPAPAEMPAGSIFVGARFRPGAGGPALGLPLADLRDQRVDLCDCLPSLARQLPADLAPDQALDRVTRLAVELLSVSPTDAMVLEGSRLLSAGRTSVAQLGTALAVSERQLRRRFDAAVGYGPKTLQRVLRFRQALAQLSAPAQAADLATLAAHAGYADQAHLTREFTRLAGRPPGALAGSVHPS